MTRCPLALALLLIAVPLVLPAFADTAAPDKVAPVAAPAVAAALGEEESDISEVRDKLKVFSDGKKHFIALVPFGATWDHFYYGDGKTFWLQRVQGGGSSGTESFSRTFWDPRAPSGWQRSFDFQGGKYNVQCPDRKTALTPLPDAEASALIATARFMKVRWKHQAYALARDEKGSYYYVDRAREPEGNKSFRLFAGPKGNLKLQKMTNVVSDSEGDMFATRTGQLRLILGKNESTWIAGKAKTKLLLVPVEDNLPLIYAELGVYTGDPLGTPCDDL
ncbi:MAG: hypothetical protein EXR72_04230 [Myxococcales bacterium]|nr:hypothetical protein [Myxococcales bacterium]